MFYGRYLLNSIDSFRRPIISLQQLQIKRYVIRQDSLGVIDGTFIDSFTRFPLVWIFAFFVPEIISNCPKAIIELLKLTGCYHDDIEYFFVILTRKICLYLFDLVCDYFTSDQKYFYICIIVGFSSFLFAWRNRWSSKKISIYRN